MAQPLDMSKIPTPDAVEPLDFETIRARRIARYCQLKEIDVADLSDNDPDVMRIEEQSYNELLLRARINDSIRATMLASAKGAGLDDLAKDPLYGGGTDHELKRLVLDPGDPTAVPPVPPTMELDDAFRARLQLAPQALSVAGPEGAYKVIAMGAHPDVVDVDVTSPSPCEILVQVLHNSSDPDIITKVYAALSPKNVRPIGDRVTVEAAVRETSSAHVRVYVSDGPDLSVLQAAAQARANSIVLPLAAKVLSGAKFMEGDSEAVIKGACVVDGVTACEITSSTGMSSDAKAWWPMTIIVTAVRSSV